MTVFSVPTAVGSILFDRRLGCLEEPVPALVQEFIEAIEVMLASSLHIIIGETLHYKLSSQFWRKHQQAWDKIFEIGEITISQGNYKGLDHCHPVSHLASSGCHRVYGFCVIQSPA